jgi:hypothetical protein
VFSLGLRQLCGGAFQGRQPGVGETFRTQVHGQEFG